MKKRAISLLLALCLALSLSVAAQAAAGMGNFCIVQDYSPGQFSDVGPDDWYAENIATAYRLGLVVGAGDGSFNVAGTVSLAETITMAARLHSIYWNGSAGFTQGEPWYQVYVDYALENSLITAPYLDYERMATRAEYASILSRALPEEALPAINDIPDGAIPDVPMSFSYAPAVYRLYRAGILTGYGSEGDFQPVNSIRRSEISAIVTRMADPSLRREFSLTVNSGELNAQEIAAQCASAVFYIEIYNAVGTAVATGSGFFIDSSGLAVTNFHVIKDAWSARIRLVNGESYEVAGLAGFSEENDLALLRIEGQGFDFLRCGESRNLAAGASVYAIGSPQGLENTISTGIISNPVRRVDELDYIQITAPISAGSSGGALLNTRGQVIGVTAAGFSEGQNLNLAIPIHLIESLSRDDSMSLPQFQDYLNSRIGDADLSASPDSLTLPEGGSATVTMVHDSDQEVYMTYTLGDKSIASCQWGQWSDSQHLSLTVSALAEGSTEITVSLFTSAGDRKLATITFPLTVVGAGSVRYYPNHYPAPDFGSFSDAPLYDVFTEGNYTTYLYRCAEIRDAENVVKGYGALLRQNGFSYVTSYETAEGGSILIYQNSDANRILHFGLDFVDGVAFLFIKVN